MECLADKTHQPRQSVKGTKTLGHHTFLPAGRFERRISKTESVHIWRVGELQAAKVEAITENVSPHGARVISSSICAPGNPVLLDALEEHVKVQARVVYCQRLKDERFAIGLELNAGVEEWKKGH